MNKQTLLSGSRNLCLITLPGAGISPLAVPRQATNLALFHKSVSLRAQNERERDVNPFLRNPEGMKLAPGSGSRSFLSSLSYLKGKAAGNK